MAKEIIEILTPFRSGHAVQRMKLDAITNVKRNDFDFRRFGEGGEQTACILVNGLEIDLGKDPSLYETLQRRAKTVVIMLFISDLHPHLMPAVQAWSAIVDVFLVPTPEMKNFLCAFTERQVEVHIDPIDFCLNDSAEKTENAGPLKVVWFGYPESYNMSMLCYENSLKLLHQSHEIEFHVVTRNNQYGRTASCILHKYVPDSFPSLLSTFDVCILSHAPFNFSVNTLWKSENKAVLAINRGLACVASRTPAYERLFTECGLQEYLFSSSAELVASIRRLNAWPERQRFLGQSQSVVLENYSALRMAEDWLKLYREARARKMTYSKPESSVSLSMQPINAS